MRKNLTHRHPTMERYTETTDDKNSYLDEQPPNEAVLTQAALDNPDLPTDFIHGVLMARFEGLTLATEFVPQGLREPSSSNTMANKQPT